MDRLKKMFQNHPNPASDAGDEAFALVTAAAECAYVCTTCADACSEEENPAKLSACIRTNLDCADIAQTTARLISRPGEQNPQLLRAQLDACATACRACAEECDKHDHEHCRICAESCRACADACDAMKKALVA